MLELRNVSKAVGAETHICEGAAGAKMAPLGKWRSLAARCVRDAEAGGSNPPFPTEGHLIIRGAPLLFLSSA